MSWVLCSVCHRVLLVEHGPTCPTCLTAQAQETEREVVDAGLSHQPTPVAKPKRKEQEEDEGK